LDATNVVRRVLVSAITNIDIDHTEWLGKTIPKIAFEKAGIIKPFVPVVTATTGSARRVIESVAKKQQSRVVWARRRRFNLRLAGPHQQTNAAVAAGVLKQLDGTRFKVSDAQVSRSFESAHWPGRFERIGSVILDGAHNVAGCRALVKALKQQRLGSVRMVFGVLNDKEISKMVRELEPVVKQSWVVPVASERSADPTAVAALPEWKNKSAAVKSVKEGYHRLRSASKQGLVVVAGSLYLVGAMRALLLKEKR
jgi:dihydrofolate synthase/folylpolyglutamate synthase